MKERTLVALLARLKASRDALLTTLSTSPLDAWVNEGTGRRVRDTAFHIAKWEHLVSNSLEASIFGHKAGVITPFKTSAINEHIYQLHRDRSDTDLFRYLESSRAEFSFLLDRAVPTMEVLLPWGRSATPVHIATDMLKHELHHVRQIKKALRPSTK